jgi:site-specific recombinase XerD
MQTREGASVHTLRHTFCTHHAAKGTNLIVTPALAAQVQVTSVLQGTPA